MSVGHLWASLGESVGNSVAEPVSEPVGSLLNSLVGQIIFCSCVPILSVKGSDVWSGEIYLQFAFSLLVAGLGLKAF